MTDREYAANKVMDYIEARDVKSEFATSGALIVREQLASGEWAWVIEEFTNCEYLDDRDIDLESVWGVRQGGVFFDIDEIQEEFIGAIVRKGKYSGAVVTGVVIDEESNMPIMSLAIENGNQAQVQKIAFDEINWEES